MIADYIPVDQVGISYASSSCVLSGAVDEGNTVTMTHAVTTPTASTAYQTFSLSVLQTLTAAYTAAAAAGRAVATTIQLTVMINGVDVSTHLADSVSIHWPDNGNGSGTMVLLGYNPFATVPTSLPIDAGASVVIQSVLTVDGVPYVFTVFTGFVAEMQYQNQALSLSLIDMSYPVSLPTARLSKTFGRTTKSHLLELVAAWANITSVVNERKGEVEDEVMVLQTTANQELPLDFMKKQIVPQTWNIGFTPTGDLQVYREQIKATPDHTITDALLLSGSLVLQKNTEGVVNAQEVTGHTYPIGQKIDPPPDPCPHTRTGPSASAIGWKQPEHVQFSCPSNQPVHPILTTTQNACNAALDPVASHCHICIKQEKKPPDNTPTGPCPDPSVPAPPLTIVGG